MYRVLVIACLFMLTGSVVRAEAPNIVVILVDDMGYGDPGCYNAQSKIPTPNIDSLAAAGMKFTDAHAPGPLCHLSRYGLMTGKYPFRHTTGKWRSTPSIVPGQMTVASLLKANGYRTAMVGKWHLGFAEDGYDKPLPGGPVDVGFDSFFGIRASTDIPPYFYIRGDRAVAPPTQQIQANATEGWSPIQGEFWRKGGIAPNLQLKDVLPRFTNEAIKVIDHHANQQDDQPLFLYLAYPAPHTPWLPSPAFNGKSGASMYGDFAMMVDANIGQVLAALERHEMSNDTLVIFTSDNGPVWYNSDVKRFNHDASGGLRGMKADGWEGGHRMPFIVRWPSIVAPNSKSNEMICFTDLMATFAEMLGQSLPNDAGPDSFSFYSVLKGTNSDGGPKSDGPIREYLVIPAGNKTLSIRQGKWKLIMGLGSGGFTKPGRIKPGPGDPSGQLYDLEKDPGEQVNLYQKHPDRVSSMSQMLQKIVNEGQSR